MKAVLNTDRKELEEAMEARDPDLLADKKLAATIKWIMAAQKQGASVLGKVKAICLMHAPGSSFWLLLCM